MGSSGGARRACGRSPTQPGAARAASWRLRSACTAAGLPDRRPDGCAVLWLTEHRLQRGGLPGVAAPPVCLCSAPSASIPGPPRHSRLQERQASGFHGSLMLPWQGTPQQEAAHRWPEPVAWSQEDASQCPAGHVCVTCSRPCAGNPARH